MVKGFQYVGSSLLGYQLIIVKDSGRKNDVMINSNISNKKSVMKLHTKKLIYKGKR